jgi:hypothetical protein
MYDQNHNTFVGDIGDVGDTKASEEDIVPPQDQVLHLRGAQSRQRDGDVI